MLTPESLKTQIRLYIAMRQLNEENGFDFCGLKGQRELTEHVTLGDIPELLMNDPYAVPYTHLTLPTSNSV